MPLKDGLDDRFKRRQGAIQRVGGLFILILGALGGVFGTSPAAGKVETREEGAARHEVEYPRLTRYQHVDRIHVRAHAPTRRGRSCASRSRARSSRTAASAARLPRPTAAASRPKARRTSTRWRAGRSRDGTIRIIPGEGATQ